MCGLLGGRMRERDVYEGKAFVEEVLMSGWKGGGYKCSLGG
jgi:hypothetical protein